ncbi:MAG: LysR family transcriptional regulator [Polyangiales bacterium]
MRSTSDVAGAELPPVESLRCFVAAAGTLNFRAAARLVALTPAALGQRIRALEEQLGAPLFARTTRSVALTRAGIELLPRARAAVEAVADCVRAARGGLAPAPVELVLGTRYELGLSWIVPQLDALAAAHPALTLHLYFGDGEDLLLRLRMREIDCAVTSSRLADPRLVGARLHPEEYVFVGASSLLKREPFSRAEHAARHTLLDAAADLPLFRYWRDAAGGGDRLRFASVRRVGTIAAIAALVRQGRGVAVLPRYLVEGALRSRALRVILPSVRPASDAFRLVYRVGDPREALFESLAESMRAEPLC